MRNGLLVLTTAALWLAGTSALAQQQPISVTVATPVAKRITQWDEYSGRFEAVQIVELRARVSGFIEKIHFRDGQMVTAGDLLFTLDKQPFELAVESAKADRARFEAETERTLTELNRAKPLARSKTISDQTLVQRESDLSVARAQLLAAQTAVKSRELDLAWAEVRAPISGRISDSKVDIGNLIAGGQAANTTVLATIVTLDPIHFIFDVSETDFLRYSRLALAGGRASSREVSNPVRVKLADEIDFTHEGKMDFVDNTLNSRSGTLRGRAVLQNASELLQPGLFGRIQLFGGDYDALLVPDSTIVSDQASKIVFVVADDGTVNGTRVELGPIVGGLRVIRSGLKASDRVVIDGLANPAVRPGAKVKAELGVIAAQ